MDNNNNNNNNNNNKKQDDKKKNIVIWIVAIFVTLLVVTAISTMANSATTKEITYNKFLSMLEEGKVDSVEFTDSGKIIINPLSNQNSLIKLTYWTAQLDDPQLINQLKEEYKEVEFKGSITDSSHQMLFMFLMYAVPVILFYLLISRGVKKMSEGGGDIMGVGKSKAKMYDMQKETGVKFPDVAGQDEAKESLTEIVDFIHNPDKYMKIGAKLPKGALLVGPPGTGKTLLAKAVAGEANVPFFSISGSDFVEMFVGVGASRVRSLFEQAQKHAPCIVFIDEIDAIGKSRDARYGGGNDEREQTLNQLLAEMDGFDTSKGVFLLAATNRPEVLDKALLRPGRFDRRIIVDKPDLKGRIDTLKVHSKDVLMDETVDLEEIAMATSGAVGSDLANMINEAAILAVKNGRNAISQADLFESVEVVIAGKEKKDRVLGEQEKRTVAYHEVGHALATALQKNTEPVQKITIVPRTMGSLGYVMSVPEEEKYLMTQVELEERLVTLLAGRAAEEIVFDTVTTGASNDMEKATDIARSMITQFGMSKKFGLVSLETVESKYLDGGASFNCSEETQAEIDREIRSMIAQAYEKAKSLLSENRPVLDEIAKFLYEKETITGKEFMEIFNRLRGNDTDNTDARVEDIDNTNQLNADN